ncbi:hybrid sensor histidine kinase/response regulator [Azospirillum sp. TSA6c]|uniref:hybrid sensor histidine kinase/response regulator n=1 Tax=unclassified Azospirillum TaxID=2630922 RepID=UPI000D608AA8|nr:hybrid sensor histidine kinase/response regulator [Azospirillum sp. TSA6c]PWC48039.1 histidine kinase [Azospirillum sp. TSA6c]PWC53684.1 histidine kinase [Azospirillum sp. TSA6c]
MLRLLKENRPLQRIGALGIGLLAVLCGGTAMVLDRLHGETVTEAMLGLRTLNASLAEQTARTIEGIDLTVSGIAEQIPLENRRSPEAFSQLRTDRQVYEILKAKASSLPQMEALSLIAADGTLVNFTRQFPAPVLDLSQRDYYLALKDADPGRAYLSRPTQSLVTREWTLYIARRVNDPDGRLAGLVVGVIRLSYFEQFYRSLHVTPGSGFSLWWRDGMLLARFPPTPDRIGTVATDPIIDSQLSQSGIAATTLKSSIDGEDRILSVQQLRNYPLVVAVSRTRGEILARWESQAVVIAAAGLVSAVALALMLWAMARQFLAYETANRALGERRQAVEARDEAEEHVRQLQKMEALGQLTGGVAHDFNNLLQAVRSSLHMLEAGGELRGAESRRALEVASQAVDRGATLTQHLLAFARRQRLAPAPVDLGAQVGGMATLLERTLGGAIRIRIDRDADVPPALVDPHQFDIALLNLAINARDAMPDGGTLTVTVSSLPIASLQAGMACEEASPALAPGGYVAVTVRDSGAGMPPDVLARACDPFFTTKPVGQGSGLGLSMVHGLTAQSGGGIRLESHPGLGTAVTLYLPHAPAESPAEIRAEIRPGSRVDAPGSPAASTGTEPLPVPSAALRILLVEDDALVRMANAAVLDEAGLMVSEAASGEEALALLEADEGIGVLVTDFAMPGMTGADLTRLVRRRRPGLPVLIVTGYAEKAVLQDLGREPGIRILSKPIPPSALIGHIRTALQDPRAAMGADVGC